MTSRAPNEVETPIINSPFAEPRHHWQIEQGKPPVSAGGRRPASYFYRVPDSATRGRMPKAQLSLQGDRGLEGDLGFGQQEALHRVNWIRQRLGEWRASGYPGVSGVTRETNWTGPKWKNS